MNSKTTHTFFDNMRAPSSSGTSRSSGHASENSHQPHSRHGDREGKPPSRPSSSLGEENNKLLKKHTPKQSHADGGVNIHRDRSLDRGRDPRVGEAPARPSTSEGADRERRPGRSSSRVKTSGEGHCYGSLFLSEKRKDIVSALGSKPTLSKVRSFAAKNPTMVKDPGTVIKLTAKIEMNHLGTLKPSLLHVEVSHTIKTKTDVNTKLTIGDLLGNDSYGSALIGAPELVDEDDDGWEDDEDEDMTYAGDWKHYQSLVENYPGVLVVPPEDPLPLDEPPMPNSTMQMFDSILAARDEMELYGDYALDPADFAETAGEFYHQNDAITWGMPSDNAVATAMGSVMDLDFSGQKTESPLEEAISAVVNQVVDEVVDTADPIYKAISEVTARQPNHSCDSSAMVPRRVADCYTALSTGYHPWLIAGQSSTGLVAFVNGLLEVYKTVVIACDGFDASMRVHPGWHVIRTHEHLIPGRVNLGEVSTMLGLHGHISGSHVVLIINFHYWTPDKSELAKHFDGRVVRVSPSPKQRSNGKKLVIRIPNNDTSCRVLVELGYTCVIQAGRDGVFIFVGEEDVPSSYFWLILQTTCFPVWVKRYGLVRHWDMSYPTPRMWRSCLCDVDLGFQEGSLEVTCYHVV